MSSPCENQVPQSISLTVVFNGETLTANASGFLQIDRKKANCGQSLISNGFIPNTKTYTGPSSISHFEGFEYALLDKSKYTIYAFLPDFNEPITDFEVIPDNWGTIIFGKSVLDKFGTQTGFLIYIFVDVVNCVFIRGSYIPQIAYDAQKNGQTWALANNGKNGTLIGNFRWDDGSGYTFNANYVDNDSVTWLKGTPCDAPKEWLFDSERSVLPQVVSIPGGCPPDYSTTEGVTNYSIFFTPKTSSPCSNEPGWNRLGEYESFSCTVTFQ